MNNATLENSLILTINCCGASASGKTTLSKTLAQDFNSPLLPIGIDSFFVPHETIPTFKFNNNQYWWPNYEIPTSIDYQQFHSSIKQAKKILESVSITTPKLIEGMKGVKWNEKFDPTKVLHVNHGGEVRPLIFLFVEGYLSCHDAKIMQEYDVNIFLNATHELCLKRRCYRDHNIDIAQYPKSFIDWFDNLVWPFYLCYRTRQLRHVVQCRRPFLILQSNNDCPNMLPQAKLFIYELVHNKECFSQQFDYSRNGIKFPEWFSVQYMEQYEQCEKEEELRLLKFHQ